MSLTSEVEELTHRYGRAIFARVGRAGPLPFSPAWCDDRLMEWSMGDEDVKVQLFRFVDVLPRLRSPAEITRHLREYFGEAKGQLPRWLHLALRLLPERGLLGRLLGVAADFSAKRLARKFIAGSNLPEALAGIARMRQRSLAFTVDVLGEATVTEQEADLARDEYLHLIDGLSKAVNTWPAVDLIDRDDDGPLPRVNVSVKLSALYSQFDPIDPIGTARAVLSRLRPILQLARARNVFVNFDMEQYAFKDVTLQVFRDVLMEPEFREWPDAGIAIQAYLHDTAADLVSLRDWCARRGKAATIRLVKGAYWDFETIQAAQQGWPSPVWSQKWESDTSFEEHTRFLLENRRWLRPAFGSHNVRSLAHAVALAQVLGVPPRAYEVQMLYGMADPIKDVFAGLGRRVRVYTPYGQLLPGMAYLVRRLLENTANESFLRASFTEHVPEEQLLMNPFTKKMGNGERQLANGRRTGAGHSPIAVSGSSFASEPLTDFSRATAREFMRAALGDVRQQFGRCYYPVIDGREVRTAETMESVDPSHKTLVVGAFGRSTADQAQQAIESAVRAFPSWRDTEPAKRSECLFNAARVIQRRRFELAAWEVYECGKPWREADGDVAEAIDFCNYYANEMLRLAVPRRRDVPGEDNVYFYEPRGVVVVIAPWNFPLAILCGMTAAALVTGNTVIMKPAEQSTVVGAKLMEVLREASIPPGVVNFLPGVGEEVGPTLVGHKDVALIAFTGSRAVGLGINRAATELSDEQHDIKRVIAELGGKNAIIVDADADLDEAVHGIAASAFGYAGQKCSACSRVLLPEALHDSFLARIVAATRSLTLAPAEEPGCTIGPVIDAEAHRRILSAIEQGKKEARLAFAGELGPLASEGFYVAPHIFADVAPADSLGQHEIFGPVLAVLKYRDFSDALQIANGTRYALTGGLYSRSPENIARAKREFRVGNLYINRKITGALVDRQPFGGFKLSGIGSKAGGPDYLLQFVLPRTITENTLRRGFAPAVEGARDGDGM
jgi:RHH-type proline utilization regulon transcriptional repressor/proline dehydrogenase/delta 1-pyrroline-5-carboxylate dehydrogenase